MTDLEKEVVLSKRKRNDSIPEDTAYNNKVMKTEGISDKLDGCIGNMPGC